jgi:hypothetical protein
LGEKQVLFLVFAQNWTGGRCYDHYFLRFLTIFGEKWHFSQKPMLWSIFFKN